MRPCAAAPAALPALRPASRPPQGAPPRRAGRLPQRQGPRTAAPHAAPCRVPPLSAPLCKGTPGAPEPGPRPHGQGLKHSALRAACTTAHFHTVRRNSAKAVPAALRPAGLCAQRQTAHPPPARRAARALRARAYAPAPHRQAAMRRPRICAALRSPGAAARPYTAIR